MGDTYDDIPPITVHPDGAIEVSPGMAHHIMVVAAHYVNPHVPELSSSTLTTVLAVAAGYSAGVGVPTREDALLAQGHISSAFDLGLAAGMENNPSLPKLHS